MATPVLVPLTMTTAFAAWMAPQAMRAAFTRRNRVRWRRLLRSPVSFTMALAAIAGVLALGSVLTVFIPFLGWSWWRALGGTGSVMLNFADVPSTAPWALVLWAKLLPVAVLVMLMPAVPAFAHAEERAFRRGAESWKGDRRVLAPCLFGLVHVLLGVTLAFAMALAVAGAIYQARYLATYARRRSRGDAMRDAVNIHAAYNTIVLCVAALVVLLTL